MGKKYLFVILCSLGFNLFAQEGPAIVAVGEAGVGKCEGNFSQRFQQWKIYI